ncbi:hypothetical protein T492DRAFT_1106937 [Pavlovales sp. CCMP2436]|nr:hypothetical protein T492DRAFT_1106937 [Pavlovales sp. CCMP2436]
MNIEVGGGSAPTSSSPRSALPVMLNAGHSLPPLKEAASLETGSSHPVTSRTRVSHGDARRALDALATPATTLPQPPSVSQPPSVPWSGRSVGKASLPPSLLSSTQSPVSASFTSGAASAGSAGLAAALLLALFALAAALAALLTSGGVRRRRATPVVEELWLSDSRPDFSLA